VNRDLIAALGSGDGVLHRAHAVATIPDHVLDHALAVRDLTALFPGIYVESARVCDVDLRERATLLYAGEGAALSHVTALRRWAALPWPMVHPLERIHVTVPETVRRRARQNIAVVHRVRKPIPVVIRRDLPVTRLERSIVDTWSLLDGPDQRAPAIFAVAERMTTPARLLREAASNQNRRGRASPLALCSALADGCRSELELWGLWHVFDDPRFSAAVRQLPFRLDGRTVYADVAFEREKVIVELDGATYHGSPDRRAQDVRRDAALAALGWVVLRFTCQRLHAEPEVVRREVLAVLEIRRRQLAA
jgi:very-short-patch-repair endonuclease